MLKITKHDYSDAEIRSEHGMDTSYYVIEKDGKNHELGEYFGLVYKALSMSESINAKIFLSMIKKSFRKLGCQRGLLKIQKNYYDYFFEILSELSTVAYSSYVPYSDKEVNLVEDVEEILKRYSHINENKKVK